MQRVQLAGRNFEIPARYLAIGQPPWWLKLLPGLDSGSRELLLMIDASEVAAAIPAYKVYDGRYKDDLRLRLVVLTEKERRRYTDPMKFSDIWDATESYQDRIIESDTKTSLVLVYRKIEYPNSWAVLTVSPTSSRIQNDVFSFWIGHCLKLHSSLTVSGTIVSCDSYALIGDVAVHFKTGGQNITAVPSIRKYLINLVSQWQKDAEAK